MASVCVMRCTSSLMIGRFRTKIMLGKRDGINAMPRESGVKHTSMNVRLRS